jgi:hypothetical protein
MANLGFAIAGRSKPGQGWPALRQAAVQLC